MMNAGKITSGDSRPAAGRTKMKQISEEIAAEAEAIVVRLLAGLGRPATAADEIEAELIASALIRGRRRRNRGWSDTAERRELVRILNRSVFRSIQPATREPA